MRGENEMDLTRTAVNRGSPPHAWGKSGNPDADADIIRLTPTCVGKIACAVTLGISAKAHPHMRGENLLSLQHRHLPSGSPPHAWGKW